MGEDMNCWNRFDFRAVLLYTGQMERTGPFMEELARVGMSGVERFWNVPSPYVDVLRRVIPCNRALRTYPGFLSTTLGHLRLVRTALALGARSLLAMESDCRFLNDAGRLATVVDSLPVDFDIALFDALPAVKYDPAQILRDARPVNAHWRTSWGNPRSFGCYALSRRAMEWFVDRCERPVTDGAFPLVICDQNLRADRMPADFRVYCAYPNAAIQVPVGSGVGVSYMGDPLTYFRRYLDLGLDLRDYPVEPRHLEALGLGRPSATPAR